MTNEYDNEVHIIRTSDSVVSWPDMPPGRLTAIKNVGPGKVIARFGGADVEVQVGQTRYFDRNGVASNPPYKPSP